MTDIIERILEELGRNHIITTRSTIENIFNYNNPSDGDINDIIETLINYCEPSAELNDIISTIERR